MENRKNKTVKKPTQKEIEAARRSLHYWLARIQARALIDLMRGKKDV